MKKLLAIVTTALTLGAFAGSAADPVITADTSAVPSGTTCTVMADNEELFDLTANGGDVTMELDEVNVGKRICLMANGEEITDSTTAQMGAANSKLAAIKTTGEVGATVIWSNLNSNITSVNQAGNEGIKLCLRATAEAPAGSTVKLTKIVIADRPNRDRTTPCYKITVDGTDYYTEGRVAGGEVVVNTAAAEASQVKRGTSIYTFAEGSEPSLSVGVVYDVIPCLADHTAQTGDRAGATCAQLEGANVSPATNGLLWWNANVSTSSGWNILGEIYGEVIATPSREPGDVYLKNNTPEYVLEDGTAVTELIAGDVIVIKSGKYYNVWSATLDNVPSGYTVKFASDANLKSSIPDNTTIVCNSTVYLYGNIGANANISGSGTLSVGWTGNQAAGTTEIAGGANISCKMLMLADHVAKVNGAVTLGSVTGAGILEIASGASIAGSNHFSSEWTGTVDLTGLTLSNGWNPANFGSAGSTVKLPAFTGHIAKVATIDTTLELTSDVTISNGYSPYTTTVTGIKGTGKFALTANVTDDYHFKFKAVDGDVTFEVGAKDSIILPASYESTVTGAVAKVADGVGFVDYCARINEALAGKNPGDDVTNVTILSESVTLPTAWTEAGYVIDADGKIVAKSTDVPGEEFIDEDEKQAYREWAKENGITSETASDPGNLAIAFHLGATVEGYDSIEEAAQAKVEELVKKIDLGALADPEGGLDAALETLKAELEPKGLVPSLEPVDDLVGVDVDTTSLYRLVIKLIAEN